MKLSDIVYTHSPQCFSESVSLPNLICLNNTILYYASFEHTAATCVVKNILLESFFETC